MGSNLLCKQHIVLKHVFFRYESSGGKKGDFSRGHGVLPFRIGRTSFKLAVTSSNWFLPVVAHDLKGIAWLVMSLWIWNSNNADVLLNSGLNLFEIMANLCSKLYYEVLLKAWNYIVHLLKWTSALDSNKRVTDSSRPNSGHLRSWRPSRCVCFVCFAPSIQLSRVVPLARNNRGTSSRLVTRPGVFEIPVAK